MRKVEFVKTVKQYQQVEAHLAEQGVIYADIWKVGVNTGLRISELLSLTMDNVRAIDSAQLELNIAEGKTGKLRKIIVNPTVFEVIQRRLNEYSSHTWLFQSEAVIRNRRESPKPINRQLVSSVFHQVGQSVVPKVALNTCTMRETHDYAMYKAGRSVEDMTKVRSHSSQVMTRYYSDFASQDI